jgi:hypothetical protein
MTHQDIRRSLADRSGVYVAVTLQPVRCQNPVCNGNAVTQDQCTGEWLCQECVDALYDAKWGFGQ